MNTMQAERDAAVRWWQTAAILAGIGIVVAIIMNCLPG